MLDGGIPDGNAEPEEQRRTTYSLDGFLHRIIEASHLRAAITCDADGTPALGSVRYRYYDSARRYTPDRPPRANITYGPKGAVRIIPDASVPRRTAEQGEPDEATARGAVPYHYCDSARLYVPDRPVRANMTCDPHGTATRDDAAPLDDATSGPAEEPVAQT